MTSKDRDSGARRRMGTKDWLAVAAGVVVVAGLATWGVMATGSAGGAGPSASTSPTAETGASSSQDPTASAGAQGTASPSPSAGSTPDPFATVDPDPIVRETLAPVPLDESVDATPNIRVELISIEAVTGVANIAGEVGGPALRVTVQATNSGRAAFETPAVVVNLYMGDDRSPAGGIREPGSSEFPGSIDAGSSASGVFIFTVPEDARETILIEVDMQVGEPVVLFEGAVR